jgi:hypothetical protein
MGEPEQRFSSACSRTENALLAWATMRGSCAHPDQSFLLAPTALLRDDLWVRTSTPFYSFSCWVVSPDMMVFSLSVF